MLCANTRPRYQLSVYRTIVPLVWFRHIYLSKHRTISTITIFVCVRGFERKLQLAYRVHLLNAWYIVIFYGGHLTHI